MATARNMILAGDYTGCRVFRISAGLAYISGTMKKMDDIDLTPENILRYEVLTDEVLRSGNSLLLTGALDPGCLQKLRLHASAAMQQKGIYTLAVKFQDEKRSLMEVDERIYRAIVNRMQQAE
ncbi:MAG TPA: hypothetical protein DCG49_01665 [Ruminococcus sp.]|nr:hypothetical protein [Ruminococcus sp.]